jgi:hypothetical protein
MRFLAGLTLLVCAWGMRAQTSPPEEPEVIRARAAMERLRGLVAAGAVPRKELEKAQDQFEDAKDAAFLRRTIYGQDLTPDQTDEMIAATTRRFERRTKAFDEARKLVEAGVAPELSLSTYISDLEMARKECDLADSRAKLVLEIADMARAEEALAARLTQQPSEAPELAERFDGDGVFTMVTFSKIESAFEKRFGKPLPVSAMGETAVHRVLGFDHRGRVDVAIQPDTAEGVWLREYLTQNHIPFFAFRHAVAGKATGAHIHLGPMSTRLKLGG